MVIGPRKEETMVLRSRREGRRDIISLIVIYILFGLAQASNEFRVLFLEEQGLNAAQCGLVLAAGSLLSAVSQPLAGALADKLRSRRVVFIGSVTFWMALIVLLLTMGHIRVAGFILCAGFVPLVSIGDPVTYGMIEAGGVNASLKYPKADFSLIRVTLSAGYCAINFLYTPIVKRFGPSAPFACTVLFLLGLLALSGRMRRFETRLGEEDRGKSGARRKLGLRRLFKEYYLICFVLLNFLMALGTMTSSYIVYLLEATGMDTALVGTASGLRVVGELLIMPLIPRIKRRVSLPMLQAVSVGCCALQLLLYLVCENPYVILSVVVLGGFCWGISLGTSAVYLRSMAPEGLDTTTLSLSTAMTNLGAIVIGLAGGAVIERLGIFSLYRMALGCLILWFVLYFGTWCFGKYVLKKAPPMPMFLPRRDA